MEKNKFGILLAARNDGIGERLRALLNAMYLSKKLGINFGFIWRETCYVAPISQNAQKIKFLYTNMESENEIFSQNFIKKHSYTKILKNSKVIPITHFKGQKLNTLKESLIKNPILEVCQYDLSGFFTDINQVEYYNYFLEFWREVEFSEQVKLAINLAKQQAAFLNYDYTSIHMRAGDVIYSENRGKWQKMASLKVIPVSTVCEIIENREKDSKIILFSDDLSTAQELKKYYKPKHQIYTIDDFNTDEKINKLCQIFYDITLCSLSKRIYIGAISGFGILASRVGGSKAVYCASYEGIYSKNEQIELILKHNDKIKLNPLRKSYEYYLLYRLQMGIKKFEVALQSAKKALKFDSNNEALRIFIIAGLLLNKKKLLCERYLRILLKTNKNFIEMLFFGYTKGNCAFEYEISVLLENYSIKNFHIGLLCALIYEFKKKYNKISEYQKIFLDIEKDYLKYENNKLFSEQRKFIMSL